MHSPVISKHCSSYIQALLPLHHSIAPDIQEHCSQCARALLLGFQSIAPDHLKHCPECIRWLLCDLKSTIQQFYVCINYFAICLKVEKEHISICLFAQFLVSLHQFFTGGRKKGRPNQVNRLPNQVDCRPNGTKSKTKQ